MISRRDFFRFGAAVPLTAALSSTTFLTPSLTLEDLVLRALRRSHAKLLANITATNALWSGGTIGGGPLLDLVPSNPEHEPPETARYEWKEVSFKVTA